MLRSNISSACDLAVIGSGPGGCAAALAASRRGLRVRLIERADVGGVCLNVGCIPTKALVSVASFLRQLRHASRLGLVVQDARIDYPAVHARNERIVMTLRRGLSDLLSREKVELIPGHAVFEDSHHLLVTRGQQRELLEAQHVIIATGASPSPGPWTFDEQRILSYRGVLSLRAQPVSLLIIGGGVIGCEFASLFAAFGTAVTIVEQQERLLPAEDPDAVRWLTRRFQAEGITVLTGMTVSRLHASSDGVEATLSQGVLVRAQHAVIAIGQRPNVETLQLASASVRFAHGIEVDQRSRTSQAHIAAIGDCVEGHGLAHWASAEGVRAVAGFLGDPVGPLQSSEIPRVVFTSPELAHVGPLESELAGSVRACRLSFAALGKSACDDETEGFVKLLIDPSTDRVRGATIVGAHASTLIHAVGLAVAHGITAKQLARTITAHPTWSEGLTETAASFYGESLVVASRAVLGGAVK